MDIQVTNVHTVDTVGEAKAQISRYRGLGYDKEPLYEKEMDNDKIVVIAWGGNPYFDNDYDPDIVYFPPLLI